MQYKKILWNEDEAAYYAETSSGVLAAVTQLVVVNFGGGSGLSYDNGEFSLSGITMEAAGFNAAEQAAILGELNAQFAAQGIVFTPDAPEEGVFSTVHVGGSDDFDELGSFAGLAETVDSGNADKRDEAFVFTNGFSTVDGTAAVIAHEVKHLVGTLDHGGGGIAAFAAGAAYAGNGDPAGQVYVNSDWSSENCGGYIWNDNAFNSIADAAAAVAAAGGTVNIVGGSHGGNQFLAGAAGVFSGGTIANSGTNSGSLYGGAVKAATGDTFVKVTGGTIAGSVYGGGTVGNSGAVTVILDGNAVVGEIYGGAARSGTTGDVAITLSGGTVRYNVTGGGSGMSSPVSGNVTITINPGVRIGGAVYGGAASGFTGNTLVTLAGGTVASTDDPKGYSGSVYGGGSNGQVNGSTHVVLSGAALAGNVYAGNFYGGTVAGDATVTLAGGTVISNVSGSGNILGSSIFEVTGNAAVGGTVGSFDVVRISAGATLNYGGNAGLALTAGTFSHAGRIDFTHSVYTTLSGTAFATAATGVASFESGGAFTAGGTELVGKFADGNIYVYAYQDITVVNNTYDLSVFGGMVGEGRVANVNAFHSVSDALAATAAGGTVEVNGGSYSGDQYFKGVFGVVSGGTAGRYFGGSGDGAVESTSVQVSGGRINFVFGGGNGRAVTGSTHLSFTGGEVIGGVYGGSYNESVSSVNIAVSGGYFSGNCNIYGGGYGSYGSGGGSASVSGTVVVGVSGGSIVNSVYGGNFQGGSVGATRIEISGTASIGGSVFGGGNSGSAGATSVTVNSGVVRGNIYGGGIRDTAGSTGVHIAGGTVGKNVYGGGQTTVVTGDAGITVSGGLIVGDIYGGGYYGTVNGNANVTISGGAVGGNIYGGAGGTGSVAGRRILNLTGAESCSFGANTVISGFDTINFRGATVVFNKAQDFSNVELSITAELGAASGWSFTVASGDLTLTDAAFKVNGCAMTLGAAGSIGGNRYLLNYEADALTLSLVSEFEVNNSTGGIDSIAAAAAEASTAGAAEICVTGGDWSTQSHQFASGVALVVEGGAFGSSSYLFGGGDIAVDAAATVAAGNVTISGTGTMRGALGGGQLTVGTGGQTVSVAGGAASLTVTGAASGSWQRLAGGFLATAANSGAVTLAGDSKQTVNAAGVTVTGYALGGSIAGGKASLTAAGTSTLNIAAGSFKLVAGGGLVQNANASLVSGSTAIAISGGTFTGNIYGGHLSTSASYGVNTRVEGDTSVLIDCAGARAVNIGNNHIFAGSNGRGTVSGSSTVTVRGQGSNLAFAGFVSGDSSGSVYYTENGRTGTTRDVAGTRYLVFDAFSGAFGASGIVNIDTLKFENGSEVTLTNAIDLSGVTAWAFEYGGSAPAMLDWGGMNDFSGDAVDFSFDNGVADLSGPEWIVMSGDCTGWDSLDSVRIFGQAAAWNAGLSAWSSTDYKLFADNNELKVAKLA